MASAQWSVVGHHDPHWPLATGYDMKPCSRVISLLADYLERRLPADVRARLERHLADCEVCLRQLRTYESTVSLLRSLQEEDLPPELRLRLRAFIDRKHCSNN